MKKERKPIRVRVKVSVIVLGQYFEPGRVVEIQPEIWDQIDDVVKYTAFDEIEEAENGEVGN
jgi:hypothetical protein